MLRISFILLITFLSRFYSLGQILDRAPSGRQNYLAVEGGSRRVKIDSTTSLDTLIANLSKDWEFVETGKMYWIGYTDDMFSIASRGDAAIQPLTEILRNPPNDKAKYGALYCLHLIGIDRRIVGRFREEFVNPKARLALQQFLKDTSLQAEIMLLLIRDPWKSDVPYIIEAMNSCKSYCWTLVNGLVRYDIKDLPIHQMIPDNIKGFSIQFKNNNHLSNKQDFDFDPEIKEVLDSFKSLKSKIIFIEDKLFDSRLTGNSSVRFDSNVTIEDFFRELGSDYYTSFLDLGSRIQYYVEDDKLYICSPETARQRLLKWWTDLSPDQKNIYNKN